MPNEDISVLVTSMNPTVDSVAETVRKAIRQFKDSPASPDADEAAEHLVEEVTRLALGWIGKGDIDEISELQEKLGDVLRENFEAFSGVEELDRRVAWSIRGLVEVLSSYLQTSNVAKSAGLLSGERRHRWRDAMRNLYHTGRGVRSQDLVQRGIFDKPGTACHALNEMAELGLLEKTREGQSALFSLAWAGQSVALFLFGEKLRVIPKAMVAGMANDEAMEWSSFDPEKLNVDAQQKVFVVLDTRSEEKRA